RNSFVQKCLIEELVWPKSPRIVGILTKKDMSALRSLTFTTIPKIGANPTFDRRRKIIALLEEQKLLLKDSKYTRTVRTWVKRDGQLAPVERRNRATFVPSLMFGRRTKKRSYSTSFSNAISVPGKRHTATFGSPIAANPRVREFGNLVVTSLSPSFAGRDATKSRL